LLLHGVLQYEGRTLAAAHAHLVRKKGLNLTHFDAVGGLQFALQLVLSLGAPKYFATCSNCAQVGNSLHVLHVSHVLLQVASHFVTCLHELEVDPKTIDEVSVGLTPAGAVNTTFVILEKDTIPDTTTYSDLLAANQCLLATRQSTRQPTGHISREDGRQGTSRRCEHFNSHPQEIV
jgi:hypothetical protein